MVFWHLVWLYSRARELMLQVRMALSSPTGGLRGSSSTSTGSEHNAAVRVAVILETPVVLVVRASPSSRPRKLTVLSRQGGHHKGPARSGVDWLPAPSLLVPPTSVVGGLRVPGARWRRHLLSPSVPRLSVQWEA